MKAWMMRSGLYRLVKGLEKRPSPADKAAVTDVEQAAMDKWDEKALKAAGELFLAIEVEQRTHLAGIEDDPVVIWTKLGLCTSNSTLGLVSMPITTFST